MPWFFYHSSNFFSAFMRLKKIAPHQSYTVCNPERSTSHSGNAACIANKHSCLVLRGELINRGDVLQCPSSAALQLLCHRLLQTWQSGHVFCRCRTLVTGCQGPHSGTQVLDPESAWGRPTVHRQLFSADAHSSDARDACTKCGQGMHVNSSSCSMPKLSRWCWCSVRTGVLHTCMHGLHTCPQDVALPGPTSA